MREARGTADLECTARGAYDLETATLTGYISKLLLREMLVLRSVTNTLKN